MDKKKKGGGQRAKKNTKNKSNLSDKVSRTFCECEGTKHPLVNNCLNCGRVVCLSEGPGPCFFCGRELGYEPDLQLASLGKLTKESDNLHRQRPSAAAAAADATLQLRDRLLEFDRDCASRTSVIDDECDYYQANNTWLTPTERLRWEQLSSKAHEDRHKSRLLKQLTVDFTGRVEVEKDSPLDLFQQMNAIRDDRHLDYGGAGEWNGTNVLKGGPVYVGEDNLPSSAPPARGDGDDRVNNRVQDRGILEISDQGVCLSMHQPYASLLVRGIKKTEGRTWYTSHRGRLWIASTVKELRADEVKSIEEMFRLTSNESIEFPKTYPTGCLLGCVTVTDVLSQEEYQKLYPDSPVDSPYIFICEDYFELPMKYPVQGKHKIYKLESVIHRAALNCLEKTCKQMSRKAH